MVPSNRHQPSGRVRPSDVAADTKRNFIPLIRDTYSEAYPPYSILYRQPNEQLPVQRRIPSTRPPTFMVETGDPASAAIHYGVMESQYNQGRDNERVRVPFICAANERRPGGDWETGCAGYEEKLCRRSNLSSTLSNPWPHAGERTNYPIPSCGGILSDSVVVYRGPHDRYERLETWYDLPVISVPPTRWPKLKENGSKYSFVEEYDMIREKIRGALRICLYNGFDRIVIGDFGLGNGYRNPPQELAEIWRDLFLFDPDLRGQFVWVAFIFDDHTQNTSRLILDEMARKESKNRNSKSRSQSSNPTVSHGPVPTDAAIFSHVFHENEIARVLSEPDPRYALQMITT